jgi:hypothetical protein
MEAYDPELNEWQRLGAAMIHPRKYLALGEAAGESMPSTCSLEDGWVGRLVA